MDYNTLHFPVLHYLLELVQTNVHWVGDAIWLSHPLSCPSPPALNLSQHQDLFQWVSSSHQVAKYWSFSFSFSPSNEYSGLTFLRMTGLITMLFKGHLRVVLQHQNSELSFCVCVCSVFFTVKLSSVHDYWENHSLDYMDLCQQSDVSAF